MQALTHTFGQLLVEVAALEVGAGKKSITHSRCGIRVSVVSAVEVVHCAAVGGYIAFEVPLIAKDIYHKRVVATAWLTIETIVGTHHAMNTGFYYKFVESR